MIYGKVSPIAGPAFLAGAAAMNEHFRNNGPADNVVLQYVGHGPKEARRKVHASLALPGLVLGIAFLRERLPRAQVRAVSSTAEAVRSGRYEPRASVRTVAKLSPWPAERFEKPVTPSGAQRGAVEDHRAGGGLPHHQYQ